MLLCCFQWSFMYIFTFIFLLSFIDMPVQLIMFSDLECDYVNPIEMCSKLNAVKNKLPHTTNYYFSLSSQNTSSKPSWLCCFCWPLKRFLFYFTVSWLATIITSKKKHWNYFAHTYVFFRYSTRKHFFDATEIFRTIAFHKKETLAKLFLYLASFFYFLYQ